MVTIAILPNDKYLVLTIAIDGVPWREIHTKIFGKNPPFKVRYLSKEDFFLDFEKAEYDHVLRFILKRLSYKAELIVSLKKQLEKFNVSPQTIDLALNECQRLGYLNDADWVNSFIRGQMSKNFGPQMIFFKLLNKGIPKETAREYLDAYGVFDSTQQIKVYLERKFKNKDLNDPTLKRKAIAGLARKGFPLEDIYQYMNRFTL